MISSDCLQQRFEGIEGQVILGWLTNWIQSWVDWFYARQIALELRVTKLEKDKVKMSVKIDELNAAVDELSTAVALLKEQVDGASTPEQVQAVTDRVKQLTASITAPEVPPTE